MKAEVLLIGVPVSVAAPPVLPAPPAVAAGDVLGEPVADGRTPTARRFAVLPVRAVRAPVAVVVPLVVLVVGARVVPALPGGLPGASVLGLVPAVLMRAAARWRPGDRWAEPRRDWVGCACLMFAAVAVESR
ncbi:hypothetical protein [Saccharothrix stipae]